jgi:hypothetical protein
MFIIVGSAILFIYGVLIIGLFMVTNTQRQVTFKILEVLGVLNTKLDSLISSFDKSTRTDTIENAINIAKELNKDK